MRWLTSATLLLALVSFSGCATSTELSVDRAAPDGDADDTAFSIPAPTWEPGYSWTYTGANGSNNTLEVEGPSPFPEAPGHLMTVTIRWPDFESSWPAVDSPDRMALQELRPDFLYDDFCSGSKVKIDPLNDIGAAPLLEFPLTPGKQWVHTWNWGNGKSGEVMSFKVIGMETVHLAAGSFDSVRIEVRTWWIHANATESARLEGGPFGETAAREGPADGVIHYAPAARAVVRLEAYSPVFVPSDQPHFTLVHTNATAPEVVELSTYSLQARDALDLPAAIQKSKPFCAVLSEIEAEQAERDEKARRDALAPPTVTLTPEKQTLPQPGKASWDVVASEGTIQWQILAGFDGDVVAAGTGGSFSYDFAAPGAYRVKVTVQGEPTRPGIVNGWIIVNLEQSVTVDCAPATLDYGGLTGAHGAAAVGGCPDLEIPIGPGTALVEVTATPRTGDGVAPCPYLNLNDPGGNEEDWAFGEHLGTAYVWAIVNDDGRDVGTWTAEWHPAATAASTVTYELSVRYAAPGGGWSFGGPGKPGC